MFVKGPISAQCSECQSEEVVKGPMWRQILIIMIMKGSMWRQILIIMIIKGPMWRQIRGQGLAYGYNMYSVVSKGLLYITLYRATNPVKAYTEARRIAVSKTN